jgi:hypothetical protein
MCRTPVSDPFAATVMAYMVDVRPQYQRGNRTVSLQLAGDPLTTFQQPVPEGWRVGPYNPVYDVASGKWSENVVDFVFLSGQWGTAAFDLKNQPRLQVGIPVIPNLLTVFLANGDQYTSYCYEDKCRFVPTAIDAPDSSSVGSISGILAGEVYKIDTAQTREFVPVSCVLRNVALYRGVAGKRTEDPENE